MALSARLNLRQSQSMVMTPQLLQSIRLLQFTHAELELFVSEQVEKNPLLETGQGSAPAVEMPADEPVFDRSKGADAPTAETMADTFDAPMDNVWPDEPGRTDGPRAGNERVGEAPMRGQGNGREVSEDTWSVEDFAASGESLRDIIGAQIALALRHPDDRRIAAELADLVDERGYLDADLDEVASRLDCEREDIDAVLGALQTFDPPGLFARDLAECLRLQCARRDRLDPAMAALLDNLPLLARRDFRTLSRLCGVDETDLVDMLEEIRSLDPHPGLAYATGGSEAVVHDVTVRAAPDGSWSIELNDDVLPKVLVDRTYHATVCAGRLDDGEKAFMSQCLADANWLERALDQRATTILKVASEIVRQQDAFFVYGVSRLRPMTMRAVADAIGMHESTVSRVSANKYMLTPRGLFEFRYFFTVALAGTGPGSEDHSSESVRQRIRELIDSESPAAVLSDDAIVEHLSGEGVEIARRTVAKYREAMGISSSVQRRREKQARLAASA